jgi:hypothetical protein
VALSALGVLDLSAVTDRLVKLLEDCRDKTAIWAALGRRFTIDVTGSMPESVRNDGNCQLCVYLFHVSEDPYQKNSPLLGRHRVPPIPFQPLSLDLFYLVTAFAGSDYVQEQTAMSIALRCFHDNPIVRMDVTLPQPLPPPTVVQEEFTLTMEIQSVEEISRLWQAVVAPFRLSAIYKASVVFVTPPEPDVKVAPPPKRVSIAVAPAPAYAGAGVELIGTTRLIEYATPADAAAAPPVSDSLDVSPAVAAPDERFVIVGNGLDLPEASRVYLETPGGEVEVTVWTVARTSSRLTLHLPKTAAVAPANTPANAPLPGVYSLKVGSDAALGDAVTARSASVPLIVAAQIAGLPVPPAAPLLHAAAGLYTFSGVGFVAANTEVLFGSVPLTATGGPPGAGQFNLAGSTITLRAPVLPPGTYPLRVRVNSVESWPSFWAVAP